MKNGARWCCAHQLLVLQVKLILLGGAVEEAQGVEAQLSGGVVLTQCVELRRDRVSPADRHAVCLAQTDAKHERLPASEQHGWVRAIHSSSNSKQLFPLQQNKTS